MVDAQKLRLFYAFSFARKLLQRLVVNVQKLGTFANFQHARATLFADRRDPG